MPEKDDKHVRFYFGFSISHIIPPNPHTKRDKVSDEDWEDRYLDELRSDVEAKLSKEGFDVAYRKHSPADSGQRLYAVDFVVSALHSFPRVQYFEPNKGFVGFSVRQKPFLKAKDHLEKKIKNALKFDYVVNAVACEYAASRSFVFEEYLGGHIGIENEISDVEDGVRLAIEMFNKEVVAFFEDHGWDAIPKTFARRPKDNVYRFELSTTRYYCYSENQVCGPLVLLEKDMPQGKAEQLGIDYCLFEHTDEVITSELGRIIEYSDYNVVELSATWIDYDEDVYEICEELI